mgnify:CR=1 FL=1
MTLSDLQEKVWALICRGRLTGADGGRAMRTVQTELLAGDVRDNVEHFEPYGFTSEPLMGSEVLASSLSGDRNHTIVLMVADRRYRLTGLKGGEVAIFDDKKRKVLLSREGIVIDGVADPIEVKTTGDIKLSGATITLNGTSAVKVNAPSITLSGGAISFDAPNSSATGSLTTTGDVTAGGISLINHTHTGDSGGTTSAPR